jgi:hypothetical protein
MLDVSSSDRHTPQVVALLTAALFLMSGCGEPPVTPSVSPGGSPQATEGVSQQQLQSWIRFRLVYGLRADVPWLLAVASDPTASSDPYAVPLLPFELDQVGNAISTAQGLASVARGYGNQFPEEFAGAWLELPVVVLGFTVRLPEHRADVEALFGDKVIVREARYALPELQGFLTTVEADRTWFPTIGAEYVGIGIDEMANVVEVQYRAPSKGVEAVIRERFGTPDWMRLTWEGPLPWTGPLGDLELTVVDGDGRPVAIECFLYTRDPRVSGEHLPREVPDGRCFDKGLAAVEWLVDITYMHQGHATTITKTFSVPPDGVVRLTVVVEP